MINGVEQYFNEQEISLIPGGTASDVKNGNQFQLRLNIRRIWPNQC